MIRPSIDAWRGYGSSCIGPGHLRTGLPNQDAWLIRSYAWGAVAVVSDGLGSKTHSDFGSEMLCLSVVDAMKRLHRYPKTSENSLLQWIHADWSMRVAEYTPEACAATCLFAAQIDAMLFLGRLGDGLIVACGRSDEESLVMKDTKTEGFSNLTQCMQRSFRPRDWELRNVSTHDFEAVVLCTDGISDDLQQGLDAAFAREFHASFSELSARARGQKIRHLLRKWPVPGHLDDKTIVCMYDTGVVG